ncbi:DUF1643 domain-containing protein [Mycolicibacterium peregrinum]|uniref:DUF1643 domain-containing protein n=1 Tax=Mycolicibacterium peregrinum TaxID=43304 RepID=UPI003AAB715B
MTLALDLHWHGKTPSDAAFSPDRVYRYWLDRCWDQSRPGLAIVGLNPSTADEHRNDQTIRREKTFADDLGYGSFRKYNLYGLRSTDPSVLANHPDPIGPDNDSHLAEIPQLYDLVILAWGGGADPTRANVVASMLWRSLQKSGGALGALGWTADGQPRHPSRLRRATTLQCLTAGAHPDYLDVDPRWTQLIADTTLRPPVICSENQEIPTSLGEKN